MADKLYAWSNLTTLDGKKVKPGEVVTQSDLEKDDEEFKATYLDTGAVRTTPYPTDISPDEAPMEYYRRQAQQLAEGNIPTPAQVEEVKQESEGTRGQKPEGSEKQ